MCYAIEKEWLDNNTCQDIQWCLCKQCDYKILKKIKPDMRMSILIKKKQLDFDEIWIYRSLCYEILEMSLICIWSLVFFQQHMLVTPFHRNFLFLLVSLFVFIASSFPCCRLILPTSGRECETRHTDRRLILPVIGLCAFSDLDFGQYCSPR